MFSFSAGMLASGFSLPGWRDAAAIASRRACGGAIPENTLTGIRRGRTMSWGCGSVSQRVGYKDK
jgi:hypothetical protein